MRAAAYPRFRQRLWLRQRGHVLLVGDDAVIQNNPDPYRGVEYSLGGQFDVGALVLSLEWHHAVGSTMRTVRSKLGYRF